MNRFSSGWNAISRRGTRASWRKAAMTARSSQSAALSRSLSPVLVAAAVVVSVAAAAASVAIAVIPLVPSSARPLDPGARGGELALQPLVAPVEVVDPVDVRL